MTQQPEVQSVCDMCGEGDGEHTHAIEDLEELFLVTEDQTLKLHKVCPACKSQLAPVATIYGQPA